jgi:hypothetical protein
MDKTPLALRPERDKRTSLGGLPVEILVIIYEHIQEDHLERNRILFTHLCSHIYYSITSTPRLWTSLNSSHSRSWRDLCVIRSKGLPLQVRWHENYDNKPIKPGEDEWMHDIFAAAESVMMHFSGGPGISSMAIEAMGGSYTTSRPVAFLYSPAPLIRTLELHSTRYYLYMDLPHLLEQLQSLITLTLWKITSSRWGSEHKTFQRKHCPAMQHLTLSSCELSLEDIYHMISAMPNLEVFEISGVYIRDKGSWDPSMDTNIIMPIALPRLRTLDMFSQNKEDVSCLLSFIPAPSQRLDVWISHTRYPKLLPFMEPIMNNVIVSQVGEFWRTMTDYHTPLSPVQFSFTDSDSDSESGDDPSECILTLNTNEDGPSLHYRTYPSLFWATLSQINPHEPIASTNATVELQLRGKNDARGKDRFGIDIDLMSGVRHVIINAYKGRRLPEGEFLEPWSEEEQKELEEWVRSAAQAGRPLQTITFNDPHQFCPVPANFTERLVAAGGSTLRIVENGINLH